MSPTFSIIMTSYNYADIIGEAIESVIAQTQPSWELIVIDDVSPDGSWEALQRFRDHPQITVLRNERNVGGAATYNRALQMASGQLIATLDSDDRWLPTFLQRQSSVFDSSPGLAVSTTFVRGIDGDSRPLADDRRARWFNQDRDLDDPATWVWTNPICHSAAVLRHDVHRQVGPLREDYFATPDWDLWIRCLAAGHRLAVLPEVLVDSRVTGAVTHTAPLRLSLEYAEISAAELTPMLLAHGRRDAAVRNIAGFFARPEFREGGPEFAGQVVERLLACGHDLLAEAMQAFAIEQHRVAGEFEAALTSSTSASVEQLAAVTSELASATARLQRIESSAVYRTLGRRRRRP